MSAPGWETLRPEAMPQGGLPLVVVAGPTASGKSALAAHLAAELHGTVVNADSMQVYAGLAVLAAQPGPEELELAPHRLYGTLDPSERCTVARWLDLAVAEIAAIRAEARLPILVGGTGLYLRALLEGLADVPEIPAAVRAEGERRRAALGTPALHAELATLDPAAHVRLQPGDSLRVLRAWEVATATGTPLSVWQAAHPPLRPLPAETRVSAFVSMPDKPPLYAACDRRLELMLEQGAWDEVTALLARDLDPELPAMKAQGVPELAAALRGETSRAVALEGAQRETRRYAKRQLTWFRHQLLGAQLPLLHGCYVRRAQFSVREDLAFCTKTLHKAWGRT